MSQLEDIKKRLAEMEEELRDRTNPDVYYVTDGVSIAFPDGFSLFLQGATQYNAGMMSTKDKQKLDNMEENADLLSGEIVERVIKDNMEAIIKGVSDKLMEEWSDLAERVTNDR